MKLVDAYHAAKLAHSFDHKAIHVCVWPIPDRLDYHFVPASQYDKRRDGRIVETVVEA